VKEEAKNKKGMFAWAKKNKTPKTQEDINVPMWGSLIVRRAGNRGIIRRVGSLDNAAAAAIFSFSFIGVGDFYTGKSPDLGNF
jgi:hypothetical protein